MLKVEIKDSELQKAAGEGMDALSVQWWKPLRCHGGELTAESMAQLNADQITLLAYDILRDEVMDGGFVQLIHNGYGAFIYCNPFARAVKEWGVTDLGRLISKSHKFYSKYHAQIEQDMTDDEFMAMFEKCSEFDDFDDEFVANEERFTAMIAYYVDEHLADFVSVSHTWGRH